MCDGRWALRAIEAEQSCYYLDDQIRCLLYRYVPEQRRVVSNQAGLGYFAERYDPRVTSADRGPIEPLGPWSVSWVPLEPSELPRGGVTWITEPGPEVGGVSVVDTARLAPDPAGSVTLFVDSLGVTGSGAETYLEMMLTNAERIAAAGPGSFVERAHGGT